MMFFGPDEGSVFRPPSEANSFLLRLTIGCSHNKCSFCAMYKQVRFRVCTAEEVDAQLRAANLYSARIRRVFLCDGDALALDTERLISVLQRLRESFPNLQRVACYASPQNILRKTLQELKALRQAGLQLVYFGLESGDDELLAAVNKGVSAGQAVIAGQRIRSAGIKLSVMVINGLAGTAGWKNHARCTAAAVAAIQPDMLSALTMMLNRGTKYFEDFQSGRFAPLTPAGLAAEMRLFFENLHWQGTGRCLFRSNHISNYFNLAGVLPRDIPALISACTQAEARLKGMNKWNPLNDVDG